jgi:aryl-alcohol dehydrogenase-like predicted oxidoreductase
MEASAEGDGMEYRLLGGSGLRVSALSFGTATFGGTSPVLKLWGETGVGEATRLVDVALDAGVTLFDTADAYSMGLAEEIFGKAIAGRRDALLISTKTGFRIGPGPNDIGASRHHLVAACEASLRRLGTDRIDLWQLHGFDALTPQDETLRALDDLVRSGKVRYVGCSNHSGWHLMKALGDAAAHGRDRGDGGAQRGAAARQPRPGAAPVHPRAAGRGPRPHPARGRA